MPTSGANDVLTPNATTVKLLNKYDLEKSSEAGKMIKEVVDNSYIYNTTYINASKLLSTNTSGIFGMPYQFMHTVDRRIDNTTHTKALGRKYTEKIFTRMPLLFLTPGKASFLKEFNDTDTANIATALASLAKGSSEGDISSILSGNGKYYSFDFAYAEYYNYVNSACNAVAQFLGLGNQKITIGAYSGKLKNFKWEKIHSKDFKIYFSGKETVPFYLDSDTSISEEFTNELSDSSLASTVNDASAQVREYAYILGASGVSNNANAQAAVTDLQSALMNSGMGGSMIKNLSNGLGTVISGGKIIFPKMWSDSDFSRSYSLKLKFRSPDHDTLSIYLNIIVPYLHLVCMAAPHESGVNGLESPFMVKGFYKGFFNCNMGMITGLSCEKGDEAQWNDDGLPTTMDVTVTLTDLYSNMTISDAYKGKNSAAKFVQNTNMLDYLAMMSGLNINKPELSRSISLYTVLMSNKLTGLPSRKFNELSEAGTNTIADLYSKLGGF